MTNPVIGEQYIAKHNIVENLLEELVTPTEHLLLCGSHGENYRSIRTILQGVQFCANGVF